MATPPENVDQPTAVIDTTPGGDGKQNITPQQLAIVGGVVLVLVLGLVYFFFLRGGGEEEIAPPPAAEGLPAPEETIAEDGGDDDDDDDGRVETFEVFAPRDPFEPLVSAAAGGGTATGTADGATGDGVTDDGTNVDPVDDGDPVGDPGTDGETVGEHRVEVIDVYVQNGNERAQIQVDGTVYTVDEGENFADNFRLVSASGQCATILFGDDEFTLCEGEEILK